MLVLSNQSPFVPFGVLSGLPLFLVIICLVLLERFSSSSVFCYLVFPWFGLLCLHSHCLVLPQAIFLFCIVVWAGISSLAEFLLIVQAPGVCGLHLWILSLFFFPVLSNLFCLATFCLVLSPWGMSPLFVNASVWLILPHLGQACLLRFGLVLFRPAFVLCGFFLPAPLLTGPVSPSLSAGYGRTLPSVVWSSRLVPPFLIAPVRLALLVRSCLLQSGLIWAGRTSSRLNLPYFVLLSFPALSRDIVIVLPCLAVSVLTLPGLTDQRRIWSCFFLPPWFNFTRPWDILFFFLIFGIFHSKF